MSKKIARSSVSCAFTGPLLSRLGAESGGIHFDSPASTGTILHFCWMTRQRFSRALHLYICQAIIHPPWRRSRAPTTNYRCNWRVAFDLKQFTRPGGEVSPPTDMVQWQTNRRSAM
jgi:hypothetical protein